MRIADPCVDELNTALAASKDAIDQLMVAGERTATAWTAPRAPGKWSPSQIVEHVARSLEESANMAAGRPSNYVRFMELRNRWERSDGASS